MWWLRPHLRRLWAAAGSLTVGLAVSYIYSFTTKRPLPDQRFVESFLGDHWRWLSAALAGPAVALVTDETDQVEAAW